MEIEINSKIYNVEIIKKNNRNTYVRVKNGKIVVTTNYLVSKNSVIKLIRDNEDSILRMIDKDSKRIDKSEKFYYFGKEYDIIYGFSEIDITDNKIYVLDKKSLDKYINKNIKLIYEDRLNYWYNLFEEKIPVPNLKIRKMTSRWGVCNIKNHNVTLNYNLSKYEICCLDYVIVHELSHFIHPNHSSDFWLLVGKYYPKYKECRKMLKE
jgi:predicted metal-dependent hydrolase